MTLSMYDNASAIATLNYMSLGSFSERDQQHPDLSSALYAHPLDLVPVCLYQPPRGGH